MSTETKADEWVYQDVFSSGLLGPARRIFGTREEAESYADGEGTVYRRRWCAKCGNELDGDGFALAGRAAACNSC